MSPKLGVGGRDGGENMPDKMGIREIRGWNSDIGGRWRTGYGQRRARGRKRWDGNNYLCEVVEEEILSLSEVD